MKLSLLVAAAENGVIGRDGSLPWNLPDDLKRFRRLTLGHHVVMGRKTHASIGRALEGRVNVVVTSRPQEVAAGCVSVPDLDAALAIAREAGDDEAFVIGGAALYAAALPRADRIYLTRVAAEVPGDVFLPDIDPATWREIEREERAADSRHAHPFAFTLLERRSRRSS